MHHNKPGWQKPPVESRQSLLLPSFRRHGLFFAWARFIFGGLQRGVSTVVYMYIIAATRHKTRRNTLSHFFAIANQNLPHHHHLHGRGMQRLRFFAATVSVCVETYVAFVREKRRSKPVTCARGSTMMAEPNEENPRMILVKVESLHAPCRRAHLPAALLANCQSAVWLLILVVFVQVRHDEFCS